LRFYKEGPYKLGILEEIRFKQRNDLKKEDKIYMIDCLFSCEIDRREW